MCVTRDRTPCPLPNFVSVVSAQALAKLRSTPIGSSARSLLVTFSLRTRDHREGWVGFLVRSDAILELLVPLGGVAARLVLGHQNLTLAHALQRTLGEVTKHAFS